MAEKRGVLVYLVDPSFEKVWLAMKKVRYGQGKWNGYGGKIKKGESDISAAVREVEEESGVSLDPKDLHKVATFYYHENPNNWVVYVYRCLKWSGEPVETEEMKPKLFNIDNLPYDQMWDNDKLWIKQVLKTEVYLTGTFWLNSEGKVERKVIRER